MKKLPGLIVLFALSLLPPIMVEAKFTKTKIAVLDFQRQGVNVGKDMGSIVSEWFTTALVRDGRCHVIERSLLENILEEQKLGMVSWPGQKQGDHFLFLGSRM